MKNSLQTGGVQGLPPLCVKRRMGTRLTWYLSDTRQVKFKSILSFG